MADKKPGDGNAKPLHEYWAHGPGSIKIAWGTKGDFDRCVKLVEAHSGMKNPEGYCAKLHKDVLGVYPGQEHGGGKK